MKFNHLTINSNHNVVQDTEKIFISDESKAVCEELFWEIMNGKGKRVEVLDGVFAVGNIGESSYEIDLCDKLEHQISIIHRAVYLSDVEIDEYDAPIVYDLIFIPIIGRTGITLWTGDFCRKMAAIAFEYFRNKVK